MNPIVIAVTITGSVPRKRDNPAVPTGPAGLVESTRAAFEAGASLVTKLAGKMRQHGVRSEIEVFGLSHIHAACRPVNEGLMEADPHVQFVLGVRNAMPAEENLLDIPLAETRRVLPQVTWAAAGIGVSQAGVIERVLARGGDGLRTGLEDNIRVSRNRLTASNAELVGLAAEAAAPRSRRPVSPAEAPAALGLPA